MAQQMAIQQAAQANNNTGQPNQMAPQQIQNLQNAQIAVAQQQHQQQQQQAAATQQPQPPGQGQPQAPQAQQPQPQTPQQQPAQQQQQVAASALMQQRPRDQIKGHCILKLVQFGDHLSQFMVSSKPIEFYMSRGAQILDAQAMKQRDDLAYWAEFVETFFSIRGVLRHSVWDIDGNTTKQYEVTFPALARYFFTHFESGIVNMQMIIEKAKEKELPNNCHYIESQKSSFIYWFDNGSQVCCLSRHRHEG
jgi:LIM-domain binding protein